jgi:hypothetical protein
MKLTSKTVSMFLLMSFLGAVVGSLSWEIVERIVARWGGRLELSVGPIGFDLSVIAMQLKANPGTIAGLAAGLLLFLSL